MVSLRSDGVPLHLLWVVGGFCLGDGLDSSSRVLRAFIGFSFVFVIYIQFNINYTDCQHFLSAVLWHGAGAELHCDVAFTLVAGAYCAVCVVLLH